MTVIRTFDETGISDSVGHLGELFICHHAPRGEPSGTLVVCPPVLADFAFDYRREVEMAHRLAERGIETWRFHYRGTGHSGGNPRLTTLTTMVADATVMIDQAASGGRRLAVFGARAGGLVAALAASGAGGLPLALWQPVEHGDGFFREAFRARIIADSTQMKRGATTTARLQTEMRARGATDLIGYELTLALYESLRDIRLADTVDDSVRRLLLIRPAALEGTDQADHLEPLLAAGGRDIESRQVGLAEAWWFHGTQRTPDREIGADLAAAVAPWLLQDQGPREAPRTRRWRGLTSATRLGSPVFVPTGGGDLFGVLTPPAAAPIGASALVLWGGTAAGIPCFGKNQVQARLAAELSAQGYEVLRLDWPGCGESPGTTPTDPWAGPARENLVKAASDAAAWLAARGPGRILLVGSCQGARTALRVLPSVAVPVGVALISPPVRDADGHLPREVDPGAFEALVSQRLLTALDHAVGERVPILLHYGTHDAAFADFQRALGGRLGSILSRAGMHATVRHSDDWIHGYLTIAAQDSVVASVAAWAAGVSHPSAVSAG